MSTHRRPSFLASLVDLRRTVLTATCTASLGLLAACTDSAPPEIGGTDVMVTSTGGTTVDASACLDRRFLECARSATPPTVTHDGMTTEMPYTGIFPSHRATIPLGDRNAPFKIAHRSATAMIMLPAPFDLAPASMTASRGGQVTVSWQPADFDMEWVFEYDCGDGSGGAQFGGPVHDASGALTIAADDLFGMVPDAATCTGRLVIARWLDGSIDADFGATTVSGGERRVVAVKLVP